jgi:hypothetical protein
MSADPASAHGWKRRALRVLTEPTILFFAIGALLFAIHRLVAGDTRSIVVDEAIKADLSRRFRDHNARPPLPNEMQNAVREWKRDEALYREALKDGLHLDDSTIRAALADRIRARTALEIPEPEPSEAQIERWWSTHPDLYTTPLRYEYQYVEFDAASPSAAKELDHYEAALREGVEAAKLGRPIAGGKLGADDLLDRLGPELSELIRSLPPGAWRRTELPGKLLLVRVVTVEGGVSSLNDVRERVIADYKFAQRQLAIDRALQKIVDRYRFEER